MGEHLPDPSQVEGDLNKKKLTAEEKADLAERAKQDVAEEVLAMQMAAQDRKDYIDNERKYREEAQIVIEGEKLSREN